MCAPLQGVGQNSQMRTVRTHVLSKYAYRLHRGACCMPPCSLKEQHQQHTDAPQANTHCLDLLLLLLLLEQYWSNSCCAHKHCKTCTS